jgi:hypothetical protein
LDVRAAQPLRARGMSARDSHCPPPSTAARASGRRSPPVPGHGWTALRGRALSRVDSFSFRNPAIVTGDPKLFTSLRNSVVKDARESASGLAIRCSAIPDSRTCLTSHGYSVDYRFGLGMGAIGGRSLSNRLRWRMCPIAESGLRCPVAHCSTPLTFLAFTQRRPPHEPAPSLVLWVSMPEQSPAAVMDLLW